MAISPLIPEKSQGECRDQRLALVSVRQAVHFKPSFQKANRRVGSHQHRHFLFRGRLAALGDTAPAEAPTRVRGERS